MKKSDDFNEITSFLGVCVLSCPVIVPQGECFNVSLHANIVSTPSIQSIYTI